MPKMNKITLVLAALLLITSCTERKPGFEFIELNTPGNSSLRAICALSENIVWVSGSQSQVLLTTDGGANWNDAGVPDCEDTEFRSLHAWDGERALVFDISPLGRAFMTTDGGQSWEKVYQSSVEGAFFNSLKFADDKHGIAISDPVDDQVFILKTEDGGQNWERLANTPPSYDGEINFAASNTCIEYLPSGEIYIVTGGSRSRILSSRDHGDNWEFIETPALTGASAGLFSVNFTAASNGVAVGGDFNDPSREGVRAITTSDGGRSWQEAESMPSAFRSCVVALNDKFLFTIGKTGCDYSVDRGQNWTYIDSTGYYAADAVEGKNIIYLSGSEGKVARVIIQTFKD